MRNYCKYKIPKEYKSYFREFYDLREISTETIKKIIDNLEKEKERKQYSSSLSFFFDRIFNQLKSRLFLTNKHSETAMLKTIFKTIRRTKDRERKIRERREQKKLETRERREQKKLETQEKKEIKRLEKQRKKQEREEQKRPKNRRNFIQLEFDFMTVNS
jgi:hypothetical protein